MKHVKRNKIYLVVRELRGKGTKERIHYTLRTKSFSKKEGIVLLESRLRTRMY